MVDGISLHPAAPSSPDKAKLKDAAGKFESMLIAQMLRSTHEAAGNDGDDSTQVASRLFSF